MSQLPASWKAFRVSSILQTILVACTLIANIILNVYTQQSFLACLNLVVYSSMLAFLYKGLTILNDNFPDTPLDDKIKKSFNRLFLLNILCIPYLFARIIIDGRPISMLYSLLGFNAFSHWLGILLLVEVIILPLHIVFIMGMIYLRRTIHETTMNEWNQLGEEN